MAQTGWCIADACLAPNRDLAELDGLRQRTGHALGEQRLDLVEIAVGETVKPSQSGAGIGPALVRQRGARISWLRGSGGSEARNETSLMQITRGGARHRRCGKAARHR